jgi:hypothetical protein
MAATPVGPADLPEDQRIWLAAHGIAWEMDGGD